MKIGIMTFWWSEDNYGQLLQCYALQKYLRDQGHDPFLIRYDPRNDYVPTPLYRKLLKALNPVKLVGYLSFQRRKYLSSKEYTTHNRQFSIFRDTYLKQSEQIYYSYDELKANPPQADCYIVGSDQVWNFSNGALQKVKKLVHAYFLDFGSDSIIRMAYAASWGREQIPDNFVDEIQPLLKKFQKVSVREKSGIDICRRCGYETAQWVCDPTLLLDAEVYRRIYRDSNVTASQKPYVLFYYLDNGGKFDKKSVFRFAQERNLDVRYISANMNMDAYEKTYATIPEWLFLVDNAQYVITNSFHCCVFSILFRKQFGAIALTGTYSGMNSRLQSLFEMTGCGERYIKDGDFSVLEEYVIAKDFFPTTIDDIFSSRKTS